MSNAKKRREAPLPASSAGLLRFFEDDTKGIKIRPEIVIIISSVLIAVSIILRFILPS